MIYVTRGNLLKADVEALVNTVNTVGVMGKGIALQFQRAFPTAYFDAYLRACEDGSLRPGVVQTFDLRSFVNPRYIINFPTKRHWRGASQMTDIESGLDALAVELERLGVKSVAVPPLGCGLGGLSWSQVFPRIRTALGRLPGIDVYVYEPTGAPDAHEMATETTRPPMTLGRAALLGLMRRYLEPMMDDAATLLEVHKLMYFLQIAGEKLRLNYDRGRYGPYATNLSHVLKRVEGHFIVGFGDASEAPGKVIEVKPDAAEEAERLLSTKPATRKRLDRVVELIDGFETPFGLELLSSVHWVATQGDEPVTTASDAARQVAAWSDRKRQMFTDDHIRSAWNRLSEQKWFDI